MQDAHDLDDQQARWADRTLTMTQLLQRAGRWLPAISVLTFLPYLVIWGIPSLPEWPGFWRAAFDTILWTVAALVIYIISALIHEALHLLAMLVVARVPPATFRFGMRLSDGVLFVHSSRPMSARAYRVVLLLPGLVLGLLPAAIGTIQGLGWVVVYGYVMIVSAIGDLIVFREMKDVDSRTSVRDHPEKIGCQVRLSSPSF